MTDLLQIAIAMSVIACALVSGVFLTFSDFVMRSLDKTDRPGGVQAMQIINREVFRTVFMVLLIGMAVVSPILIWLAWAQGAVAPARPMITAGGLIYLVLVFGVTAAGNVPMNQRLDVMDAGSVEAHTYWSAFYRRWTAFNHIRTVGAAAAAVCFLLAGYALAAS